jgi:EAL domain-containing protein (putative c-di-GMP-specific phosphodiesterase class I)/GGDEF domain-containing protein
MQTLQRNLNQLYQIGSRDDLVKDLDIHLNIEQQIDLGFPLSFSILKINKYNKIFNNFGRKAADYVLSILVERLINALKDDASLYRLNPEEFGIIFKHQNMDQINKFVKFLLQPIPYGHDFIDIQLSLGLVDITTQIKKHSEVLRRADIALKLAKSEALNWQYFNHHLDYFTHTDRDMFIALEKAMDNNLLHLAGQPIFNLDTGQVIMVEILLRWQHAEYGAVNPTKIIELASKNGYLSKVALYVAKQLVIFLNNNDDLYQDISFALNFNMPQIINITLIQELLTSFDEFGIDKSRFIFEATEIDSCPVSIDNVVNHFKWIKQQGIKIAIDDFGSGYSTLDYVNNLDVDIIKIDRSLVCDIETKTRKLETLIALLQLCHKLGVIIVVEGVENLSQHNLIKNIGISNILVQGYFYAKPSSLKEQTFCDSTYFKKSESYYLY